MYKEGAINGPKVTALMDRKIIEEKEIEICLKLVKKSRKEDHDCFTRLCAQH